MDVEDSRRTFQKVYTALCILFWMVSTGGWVCYGVTQSFLKGTGGYQGSLIALASMIISIAVNCGIVASKIKCIRYQEARGWCSFHVTIGFLAFYPVAIMLASMAVMGVSIAFGIYYDERTDDDKQVNVSKNETMGIINTILGAVGFIVSVTALYFGQKLRGEWCRAKEQGQGIFAREPGMHKV